MLPRCGGVNLNDPLFVAYHDFEWGVPVHEDRLLFEYLILEGMQAGLSWSTVLRKRENFRRAFDNFEPGIIAAYDEGKVEELMNDPGIIRNHRKILAAIGNARAFLAIQAEFGTFDAYSWQFVGGRPIVNRWKDLSELPAHTPDSDRFGNRDSTRTYTAIDSTAITAVTPAPTTGQYLVIDGIMASCDATLNVTLTVESANSTAIGKFYFVAGGHVNWTPQGLFKLPTVTKKLNAKTSGAGGNVTFQVFTHSEA